MGSVRVSGNQYPSIQTLLAVHPKMPGSIIGPQRELPKRSHERDSGKTGIHKLATFAASL